MEVKCSSCPESFTCFVVHSLLQSLLFQLFQNLLIFAHLKADFIFILIKIHLQIENAFNIEESSPVSRGKMFNVFRSIPDVLILIFIR